LLATLKAVAEKRFDRIQELARRSRAAYIGTRRVMVPETTTARLFPTTRHRGATRVLMIISGHQEDFSLSLIIENPSQFTIRLPEAIGQQMREVSIARTWAILSLFKYHISDRFHPQDREAFIAEIPLNASARYMRCAAIKQKSACRHGEVEG